MSRSFACTPEDMHPYECDGPGKCRHCDRRVVIRQDEGTRGHVEHDPKVCALCDPAYDGAPAA